MGYRALLFDLDGVIVSTEKNHFHAWKKTASQLGISFSEKDNEALKGVNRVDSLKHILALGKRIVPDEEFDSMGCNVLALAPRVCLMVKENPITKSRLEAAGCKVIEYEGAEISVKGGGGPTCLTRPVMRS